MGEGKGYLYFKFILKYVNFHCSLFMRKMLHGVYLFIVFQFILFKLNFAGQVSYVCWKYIQSDSLDDNTPEYTLKNQRMSVFLLFSLPFLSIFHGKQMLALAIFLICENFDLWWILFNDYSFLIYLFFKFQTLHWNTILKLLQFVYAN